MPNPGYIEPRDVDNVGLQDATVEDFLLPLLMAKIPGSIKAARGAMLDRKLAQAAQRYSGNSPLPGYALDFSDKARNSYRTLEGVLLGTQKR